MAEKKYLDYAGLQRYNAKLRAVLADKEEAAKAYTDEKIGTLDNGVATVAAALAGEKQLREAADTAIHEKIGTVPENVGETATADVVSYIDAKVAVAQSSAADAIEGLKKEDTAVEHQFVTSVSQEDGIITVSRAALTADDIPALTLEKITGAGTAAAADVATVAIGAEGEATDALVTSAQVKTYVDGLDGASSAAIAKLNATHATVTEGEGDEAVTRFQTVQEEAAAEVAKVVAEAPEAFDTLKEIAEWIQKSEDNEDGFDAAKKITALEGYVDGANLVVAEGENKTVVNAIAKAISDEDTAIKAITGTPDEDKTLQDEIDDLEAVVGKAGTEEVSHEATEEDVAAGKAEQVGDKVIDQPAVAGTGVFKKLEELKAEIDNVIETIQTISDEEIDALFDEFNDDNTAV